MSLATRLTMAWVCCVSCGFWAMAGAVGEEPMHFGLAITSGLAGALLLVPTEDDDG